MMNPQIETNLLRFLEELQARLRQVRDDKKALWLSLRSACDFFRAGEACLATLPPGKEQAELMFVVPRGSVWDLDLLTAFLRRQKPSIPGHTLLAPLNRRGRLWAVLGLRLREGEFDRDAARAQLRVARAVSESIQQIDRERIIEVRSRIDRKIMEQLRPKDLFYQILHGLRSLTRYDHSSALLICEEQGDTLELVAEQVAWLKGKSRRIGLRLPLTNELWDLMRDGTVYGFDRDAECWRGWSHEDATALAELLDYNCLVDRPAAVPREAAMLCAPLATRDGVLGVLKVAALHQGTFGTYEAELLRGFMPLAAVAIQNSQRAVTLEARVLAAEKKHAIANLVRGVSHDINNALGSVLPLVQQMKADSESACIETHVLSEDLRQVEQSLQTCRRIFGGMLALARGSAQHVGQGNVHRAVDCVLAILKDSIGRQGIRLDLDLAADLPAVRGGQGDLEQLILNLMTNARDAMPTGGLLSLRARQTGEMLEIFIEDTGCGIPEEHMARIHEPFFTTKHTGTGLGLSICRSITWDMRGDLQINSTRGIGTEVRVLLPVISPADTGVEV
jgi:two-component system, NtrC family, sensor kinase